jgi:DNA polymerase-3 subunit epsilon
MREIVMDTETTGLDPRTGDRIVEIGGVELINHIPTGQTYHVYINPERSMPREAFDVHGLSAEFLKDKPKFSDVADGFIRFIEDATLVIHNAPFDIGFLNAELGRLGKPAIPWDHVIDTLALAKRRHPAGPNSLDALCSRYGIDNSRRVNHGALLDSELLAEVYIELIGGKQAALGLGDAGGLAAAATLSLVPVAAVRQRPQALPSHLSVDEIARHQAFVTKMGAGAIWNKYLPPPEQTAE